MSAWYRYLILFTVILLSAGCAKPQKDPPPTRDPAAAEPAANSPAPDQKAQPTPRTSLPESFPAVEQPAPAVSSPILTQADIEQLVVADLAARIGVAPQEARIAVSDLRRWPDGSLGCRARPGVFEPLPTPGYLIQLEAKASVYEYHTDLHGMYVLCPTPSKPIDPIQ